MLEDQIQQQLKKLHIVGNKLKKNKNQTGRSEFYIVQFI